MSDTSPSDSAPSIDIWSQRWEPIIDDSHAHLEDISAGVADAVANAMGDTENASATVMKRAKKLKASRAMTAMKNRVGQMTAPITKPIKKVMTSIETRAMQLIDQMKHGEHLSMKQLALIFAAPGGALILVHHYAKMFSKKAEVAIQAGKTKWEGFLHSLWLWSEATPGDIAQAEAAHEHHGVTTSVWEVVPVDQDHAVATANDESGTVHGVTEHPDQTQQAA